jgi:hypothetical protein
MLKAKGPIFLQEFFLGAKSRRTNSFKFLSSSVLVHYLRITIESDGIYARIGCLMRKQTINSGSEAVSRSGDVWLDLERLAQVEITSESAEHPIESALIPDRGPGWRAVQPGKQTIRLIFDQPVSIGRILLRFEEEEQARTQEFVLRWLPKGQQSRREIVRQQYTFSPPATNQEIEDYSVKLDGVIALELEIVPDISGGGASASLAQMRLA